MPSSVSFLDTFLSRQRLRGHSGPLLGQLEAVAQRGAAPSVGEPTHSARPIRTLQQFSAAPVLARTGFQNPPQTVRLVVSGEQAIQTLTAALDAAPCRDSARRIFRVLFTVALEVARHAGHASSVTRAVFHLPAELLMVVVGLRKSAFYDNLGHLQRLGLVASQAHMGDLRGEKVATGTLWAVSLQPGRVLGGHAAPVRLVHDDWNHGWRDLNRDVRAGRTVWNLLHPRGQTTPEGQEMPESYISLETLKSWAITSAGLPSPDTLTVRAAPGAALDVVWQLGEGAAAPRWERARIVDRQARTLAAAFGDSGAQLGFWRKLIWNLLRGIEAGCDLTRDVGALLMTVLRDLQHDHQGGGTTLRRPAARANAVLGRAQGGRPSLLDQLRCFEHLRVASRPAA